MTLAIVLVDSRIDSVTFYVTPFDAGLGDDVEDRDHGGDDGQVRIVVGQGALLRAGRGELSAWGA